VKPETEEQPVEETVAEPALVEEPATKKAKAKTKTAASAEEKPKKTARKKKTEE